MGIRRWFRGTFRPDKLETDSVDTAHQTIKNKETFQDGTFTELGVTSAVKFTKRIDKFGTSVSWTNAARFDHSGNNNRAIVGYFDLVIASPPDSTSTASSDSFIQFADKDNNWGSTGSTTNVGTNVRIKVDDNDASIAYLQVDLNVGNGFENGLFDVGVITNSNEPTVLDPDGWTS